MAKKSKARRGHGEGTITKRADGRWMAQITIGYDKEGKQKRKTFYGKTEKEVRDKLLKARYEFATGSFADGENMKYERWLLSWMENYKKMDLSYTTHENYFYNINTHILPYLGHVAIKDIRPEQIQSLYNQMIKKGLSPSTVRKVNDIISGSLKQARKNNLINNVATERITLPKMKRSQARALTLEEQQRFFTVLDKSRYGFVFRFMIGTGLREGELLALQTTDWDQINETITINKNVVRTKEKGVHIKDTPKTDKSNRIVPLPPKLVKEFEKYLTQRTADLLTIGINGKKNTILFPSSVGTLVSPENLQRAFKALTRSAGLPDDLSPHSLRHTYATRLLEKRVSLKEVQELLGHANWATTANIYSHVSPELKREAVDKLDEVL